MNACAWRGLGFTISGTGCLGEISVLRTARLLPRFRGSALGKREMKAPLPLWT